MLGAHTSREGGKHSWRAEERRRGGSGSIGSGGSLFWTGKSWKVKRRDWGIPTHHRWGETLVKLAAHLVTAWQPAPPARDAPPPPTTPATHENADNIRADHKTSFRRQQAPPPPHPRHRSKLELSTTAPGLPATPPRHPSRAIPALRRQPPPQMLPPRLPPPTSSPRYHCLAPSPVTADAIGHHHTAATTNDVLQATTKGNPGSPPRRRKQKQPITVQAAAAPHHAVVEPSRTTTVVTLAAPDRTTPHPIGPASLRTATGILQRSEHAATAPHHRPVSRRGARATSISLGPNCRQFRATANLIIAAHDRPPIPTPRAHDSTLITGHCRSPPPKNPPAPSSKGSKSNANKPRAHGASASSLSQLLFGLGVEGKEWSWCWSLEFAFDCFVFQWIRLGLGMEVDGLMVEVSVGLWGLVWTWLNSLTHH